MKRLILAALAAAMTVALSSCEGEVNVSTTKDFAYSLEKKELSNGQTIRTIKYGVITSNSCGNDILYIKTDTVDNETSVKFLTSIEDDETVRSLFLAHKDGEDFFLTPSYIKK